MNVSPEDYQFVFCHTEQGKRILEHFRVLFDGRIFDEKSERKTDYNLGKHAVYNHILKEIEKAEENGRR